MNIKEFFEYVEYELQQNGYTCNYRWNDYFYGEEFLAVYRNNFVCRLNHMPGGDNISLTDAYTTITLSLTNFEIIELLRILDDRVRQARQLSRWADFS